MPGLPVLGTVPRQHPALPSFVGPTLLLGAYGFASTKCLPVKVNRQKVNIRLG